MKRVLSAIIAILFLSIAGAQTTIDKPAATIKLSRQEVVSVRQLRSDVERLEKAAGVKFSVEQIKQVLDARINSLLFVQFCEREKIVVSDADVTKALTQMKASIGQAATDADIEASLRASGVFVEPRVYIRQRLLFEAYVKSRKATELKAALAAPTPDDILKAYDLAKASLVRPDTMRVSVLYVDTRGRSDADSKKAKETLQSLANNLKINPARFDEYMLRASESAGYKSIPSLYMEKTSQNKTLFGADLFDAVFKLKVGDISAMIESPTGFRIVRANEFLPQKQLGLSDTVPGNQNMTLQEFLMYQVAEEKEMRFMDSLEAELIEKLRTEATIKIFEDNLKW
jgi:parvulin-like peptidyl-prolyl isomerase